MARFVVGAVFGLVLSVVGGAALGLHAADEGGALETPDASAEDATVVAQPTPEPPYGLWDRLANCESSGRWHLEGGRYSGGLQFDSPTWIAYGGLKYAPRAALASRAEQIAVAEVLRSARGFVPWPVCSRVVGLR